MATMNIGFDKKYTRGQGAYLWNAQKGLFGQFVVTALMGEHHILNQVSGPDANIIKLLPPLIICAWNWR
jgi:hypothetical protein